MPRRRSDLFGARGQSLVEFALILPLLMFLMLAIGDFGRLYATAVSVESAAREAADYGAFLGSAKWPAVDDPWTTNITEMRRRACTAASSLPDYQGDAPGTPGMTCSNPAIVVTLERKPAGDDCSTVGSLETPCIVHVTLDYDFHTVVNFPPLPATFHLTRDSQYPISDLTP